MGTEYIWANLFSKDQIVEIIDSVDLHYYEFENNVNYKNYSKKTQARFKSYLNATHFALIAIDGLSSREIIKFKYDHIIILIIIYVKVIGKQNIYIMPL